jgi:hypothetical protein
MRQRLPSCVFEPHTEAIRKCKIAKFTTAYDVHEQRPADVTLWTAGLDGHLTMYGRAPDLTVGDRGFSSANNL